MKHTTFTLFLYIATLVAACLMALSLGGVLVFFLWSAVPLVLFTIFLRFRFRPLNTVFKKVYTLSMFFVLTVLPGAFYILWLLNVGEIATGSSTSAIILVWVPVQVVIIAVPVLIIFEIIRLFFFRDTEKSPAI
jgi:hypothetical protein